MRRAIRPSPTLAAVAAITLAAGALRFDSLGAVALDPFYDAAVRSMSLSLHNFFFGAFEPGASVSIDKPPADLWLQVVSVKLLGFGPVALKLPEALAGTAAVPLLYDALRRAFGPVAGLCSAAVLAALPIAVLTARSDTMDSVMMLLTVAALWLLIHYHETGRRRCLYLAAVAIGVAFNVKLFEALVALPALALLVLLPATAPLRTRILRGLVAGAVLVAVSLSWLLATLLAPAQERPFAIGSSDGSAWNAAFVFNGVKRIGSTANEFSAPVRRGDIRPADNSELARGQIPIGGPGPLRLFDHDGPLSGLRLGFVLVVALLLGAPALLTTLLRRFTWIAPDAPRPPPPRPPSPEVASAAAAALLAWLLIGFALFSAMTHLHPRYTEAFTPAVAAAAGVGIASVLRGGRLAIAAAAICAVVLSIYSHHLLGTTGVWIATALTALVALVATAVPAATAGAPGARSAAGAASSRRDATSRRDAHSRRDPHSRRAATPAAAGALAALLVATLALPISTDASEISHHESDSGHTGTMKPALVHALSAFLRAHRAGARYELAVAESTQASSLIVADAMPVLVLTSLTDHQLVSARRLQSEIARGTVRYAYVGGGCDAHASRKLAACTPVAAWIRAHASDVSREAGLAHPGLLWRLNTR